MNSSSEDRLKCATSLLPGVSVINETILFSLNKCCHSNLTLCSNQEGSLNSIDNGVSIGQNEINFYNSFN